MNQKNHHLKTWPEFFEPIQLGEKKFEVRKNDRDFMIGDILILEEYDPETETYTGRIMKRTVSYTLLGGQFGIEEGYIVMSIK